MQQTDFMYELVIGEDCSTDNTLSICRSYQNKSPSKIKILANKINLGLNLNFINTLKACKGQYIAYLEGDDHWKTSDKLQKQVDIMEQNPDISLIHTNFCVHDIDNKTIIHNGFNFGGICPREINYGIESICAEFEDRYRPIKASTCVYLSKAIREMLTKDYYLFANKEFPAQDFQLYQEMSLRGKFYFLDEETTVIGLHDSISAPKNREEKIKFALGVFKIGIYLIDKYKLPIKTLTIWFRKQIYIFQRFAISSGNTDELSFVFIEAKKRGYYLNWRQKIKQGYIFLLSIYKKLKCSYF